MTFEEECVEALNNYRRRHSADELQLKEELSRHAQDFAKRLALAGELRHSNNRKYGENVAVTTSKKPKGEEIAKAWYNEMSKYDFNKPGPVPGTGHFTQVVWRATTHVGIGHATGRKGTFVVANFHPIGNVVNPGYFEKNVIPLEGEVPSTSSVDADKQETQPQDGSEDTETTEEVTTKGDVEIRTITTIKRYVDSSGRKVKDTSKEILTTTTKKGRKSTTKQKTRNVEFEEEGEVKIKKQK